MLSLFRVAIGHMLSSTTRLSRQIRRHMREIVDMAESGEFEKRWKTIIETVAPFGIEEEVREHVLKELDTLYKHGILELLELEMDEEAMERRFAFRPEKVVEFLQKVHDILPPSAAKEERQSVRDAIQSITDMYETMLADIKKAYLTFVEQQRGVKDHQFVTGANGIAMLTRMMRDVYKLRGEWREEKTDIEKVKTSEEWLYRALFATHVDLKKHVSTLPDPEKTKKRLKMSEELRENCKILVNHVTIIFDEFVIITREFVHYYFLLIAHRDQIDQFIEQLKGEHEHFTHASLLIILEKRKQLTDTEASEKSKITDAEARMGRLIQQMEGKLKAMRS
jgi:hypothetical protein